jgi:hypothetical protein
MARSKCVYGRIQAAFIVVAGRLQIEIDALPSMRWPELNRRQVGERVRVLVSCHFPLTKSKIVMTNKCCASSYRIFWNFG